LFFTCFRIIVYRMWLFPFEYCDIELNPRPKTNYIGHSDFTDTAGIRTVSILYCLIVYKLVYLHHLYACSFHLQNL